MGLALPATLFDSIRAFLISSTVPIATGPTNSAKGLVGEEGGVLTGLSDGLFDGDLTTGVLTTGTFTVSSYGGSGVTRTGLTGIGLTCGFSATLDFFSGFTM